MKRIILLMAIIALTLSLGCKDETTTPTSPNLATTPTKAIENFSNSFDSRDIAQYKSCLSEDFTFYFNPADVGETVGDGYVIPESWGYEDDWRATQNMFDFAYSITLDLPSSQIGDPPEGVTEYTQNNVYISLLVMTTSTDGLRADGFVTFTFEKMNEGGTDVWKIRDFFDYTSAKKGIETASLGTIKAEFYSPPTQ